MQPPNKYFLRWQLGIIERVVDVSITADHVRQHKHVSVKIHLEQSRDQSRQSIVPGPPGVLVDHSDEDRKTLSSPADSSLDVVVEVLRQVTRVVQSIDTRQ